MASKGGVHANHAIGNFLELGRSTISPDHFANDIVVVKQDSSVTQPGRPAYTLRCSCVDVIFKSSCDIRDWDRKIVEVAVGDNKIGVSLHQLRSKNDHEALHRWPAERMTEAFGKLQLEDGVNEVTFTLTVEPYSKVKARIFLWPSTVRIVVTDIDGTISTSDVKARLQEALGRKPTHPGAVDVFSKIKERGYEIIYLSGRPKSDITSIRRMLFDNGRLPDGPVLISTDGLVECGFRELCDGQAKFKAGHLEAIQNMFPGIPTPFHAGFGNRKSDRSAYLQVKIPVDKIFEISNSGKGTIKTGVSNRKAEVIYNGYNALIWSHLDSAFKELSRNPSSSVPRTQAEEGGSDPVLNNT